MNRKEFFKTVAAVGLATGMNSPIELYAQTKSDQYPVDLVALMGSEPVKMFQKGIEYFGGMKAFVKYGQTVVIKPNIAWDKTPELGATTQPELVAEIVRQTLAAGAKRVIVFDHTCDEWRKTYKTSGIEKAAKEAGAEVLPADNESQFVEVELPYAKRLKGVKIFKPLVDCDVWINVPILKHHGGARFSCAMKNLMGIVWNRQAFHRNDLNQTIAEICTWEKTPVLNVVDASRVIKSNGPRGRSEADVAQLNGLFLSPNIVTADIAALKFFGQIAELKIDDVAYLKRAEELGVGTIDLSKQRIERIKL